MRKHEATKRLFCQYRQQLLQRGTRFGVLSVLSLSFEFEKSWHFLQNVSLEACFAQKTTVVKLSKETFSSFLGCSSFKYSNNDTPYGTSSVCLEGFPVSVPVESLFF